MKNSLITLFMISSLLFSGCKKEVRTPSEIKDSVSHTAAAPKQFIVKESAFTYSSGYGNYVQWVAVLENPNLKHLGVFPAISITAKDEDGKVLGTEDQVFMEMPPGISFGWAGQLSVSAKPSIIEIKPIKVEWRTTVTTPQDYKKFTTKDVSLSKNSVAGYKITGEINNPFSEKVDQLALVVLARDKDGQLYGGDVAFVDTVEANNSRAFSISMLNLKTKPDATEIYAFPWGSFASWNKLAAKKYD